MNIETSKIMALESSPCLTDLSHELLCHILRFLPLKETLSISMLCRKLSSAVSMHLHLCRSIEFCEGKIYGYMPSSITDEHMHSLLRKCPHLEVVKGLHPLKVERRRLRKRSALTVPGIIEALSLSPNLKAIETCDLRLLEAILQHLPQLEIIGHFRNRDGVFPPHASQRLKLQPYPKVASLHLTGIEVPELTAMPHLQHLHLHCVRFTKLQPFRAFLAQNLKTFVMKHCMGPSLSLRYLSLIIALSSSPSLTRLELVRVPLPGGLFQRAVEDSYRHNGFVNLKTLVISGCKGVLEADLGHLMIVASKSLETICIQPSLTKDSLFVSLSFAHVEFPKLKNLHLGFVDKLNFPGEWSNDILLTLGLAEVPDTPSSLTDSGMKVISELFQNIQTMSVSNCPHLMAMNQWSYQPGLSWQELEDLTLQRCHCLQLPSFALFLALLPKIQVVILNDMFREPPKGCSHVGLSAGTGLGMSSAVVSNQDEHIAVQGHQQDFEPQADEPIENEEMDREYVEVHNEAEQEGNLAGIHYFPPVFFDEENDALHAPLEQEENFPQPDPLLDNHALNVAYNGIREHNNYSDRELIQHDINYQIENEINGCIEAIQSLPTFRHSNTENRDGYNNPISSRMENNSIEIKKRSNPYHLRKRNKKNRKGEKHLNKPIKKEKEFCGNVSHSQHSSLHLKCNAEDTEDQKCEGVSSSSGAKISPCMTEKSNSCGLKEQNTSNNVNAEYLNKVIKTEKYDPYQPSTSKAGSFNRYSSTDSESDSGDTFSNSNENSRHITKNHKRVRKGSLEEQETCYKRIKKSQEIIKKKDFYVPQPLSTSNDSIELMNKQKASSDVPEEARNRTIDLNYFGDSKSHADQQTDNSLEVYKGPLTRHRKRMLTSYNIHQSTVDTLRKIRMDLSNEPGQTSGKHITHNDILSNIKKENDVTHCSVKSEFNEGESVSVKRCTCESSVSCLSEKDSPSCSRYQNRCNCPPICGNISSPSISDDNLSVSVKSEPDTVPKHFPVGVPYHCTIDGDDYIAFAPEESPYGKSQDQECNDDTKRRISKRVNKKRKCCSRMQISNNRPITRNQEKMHSSHELLDIVSQGTQATSADIRRTLRGQKGSNTRQRRTGHAHTKPIPVRHSKISSRQQQKRYKYSKPLQDFQNKATSTSDPLLEDDAVQTLRLVSESLISLTIVSCGISDIVFDHCNSLTHIEVQACRILKEFQLHFCPSLKRLNISQCPKLDVKVLVPEVLSLEFNNTLLVSFEPCVQGYHQADGEQAVFSKATPDQNVILFHDFTDNSRENIQAMFMENLYFWMLNVQRLWKSLVFQRLKQKKPRLKPEKSHVSRYPWGHDLRRIYGHYTNSAVPDHPVSEWRYQIVTNNHLFASVLELFEWDNGFPQPDESKIPNCLPQLPYEVAKRSFQMQKRVTAFYIPITE